jgi:acetoin utilization protein AcuC
VVEVVPRAWTHLLAIAAGRPLDPSTSTPEEWRAHVSEALGVRAPSRMTDGRTPLFRDWIDGYDPDSWLDRSIHETRMAAFPLHGLDPHP